MHRILLIIVMNWTPSSEAYSEIILTQSSLVSMSFCEKQLTHLFFFSHTDNSCAKWLKLPSYLVASVFLLSNLDDCRMPLNKAFFFFSDNKNWGKKLSSPLSLCFLPWGVFCYFCRRHKALLSPNRLQLPTLLWVQTYRGTTRAITLWMQVNELWELDDKSHIMPNLCVFHCDGVQ